MVTALARASYAKLIEKVRRVLIEGRLRAQAAVEEEKVRSYWEVGRIVNEHLRLHDGRAGYGEHIVTQMAEDLGMGRRLLYEILHVQRTFPIVQTCAQLRWSQCQLLSRVKARGEREKLLREARDKDLSVRELLGKLPPARLIPVEGIEKIEISRRGRSRAAAPLRPRRGILYTYRIVKPRDLHTRPDFYSIDLGLTDRVDFKVRGVRGLKEGSIIEAVRTEENPRGDRYKFRKSEAGPKALYTHKASIVRLIDLDTYWADFDLGFRFWTEDKLRLRGVDAPEKEEVGRKGMRFLKKLFARVPFVVVKLSGRDKFGRPLADLFYLEGERDPVKVAEKGKFLNQELIDRGLAVRV